MRPSVIRPSRFAKFDHHEFLSVSDFCDCPCGPMAEFKLSMDFELCSIIRSGFLLAFYPFLEFYRCLERYKDD